MDGCLIDFDSPKYSKDEPFLHKSITGFLVPLGQSSNHCPTVSGEDNPFDLVVSQVAAITADQNDPFEVVLNDALSCQEDEIKARGEQVSLEAIHLNLGDSSYSTSQEISKFPEKETLDHIDCDTSANNSLNEIKKVETQYHNKCESTPTREDIKNEEWNCLDDIPPPDSLLSSPIDMSYLLDDTLSTSILNLPTGKDNTLADEWDFTDICNNASDSKRLHGIMTSVPSPKSEEDLKLLAQKKIENLINRAEFEVKLDIQDSALKKRLSIQNIAAPSTPRSVRDVLWESEEQSRCLLKWSQQEFKKFDFLSNMTQSDSCPTSLAHELESKSCKDNTSSGSNEAHASCLETPSKEASSLLSPVQELLAPGGESFHLPSGAENTLVLNECLMQGSCAALQSQLPHVTPFQSKNQTKDVMLVGHAGKRSSTSTSPVLLPLPLCEDAVRNLSLCSKYSPRKDTLPYKNVIRNPQNEVEAQKREDGSKQAKLVVRKPTEPLKTHPKMAPMKATAPVQNMTRARSSLTAHFKGEPSSATSLTKKSVPKASCLRMPPAGCLRKPDGPTPTLGGSLPNLTSQVSKLPTRLPSPRKSAGSSQQKPITFRKQDETSNARNLSSPVRSSPFVYSSPRPFHKGTSSGRSASLSRVLTDINTSPSARKSMKCRNIQVEVMKRGSRTEKENFP